MKNSYRFDVRVDNSMNEDDIIIQCSSRETGTRIITHLEYMDNNHDNLVLKQDEEYIIIQKQNIVFAEVYGKDLAIHTTEEEISTAKTLASLLEALPPETFIQISKSSILNINCIRKVEPSFSGNLTARLSNGMKAGISRRYVKNLKQRLGI